MHISPDQIEEVFLFTFCHSQQLAGIARPKVRLPTAEPTLLTPSSPRRIWKSFRHRFSLPSIPIDITAPNCHPPVLPTLKAQASTANSKQTMQPILSEYWLSHLGLLTTHLVSIHPALRTNPLQSVHFPDQYSLIWANPRCVNFKSQNSSQYG